ncbi:glycosyltransferase family 9 protein [Ideonella sp. BN130291]|uniref:glycosyltransferase family 9 protein n=1 Tax=Ideonella sp. BN130291 TaxID=3112940 RepID=UPI002E272F3E|nr:glycosyltransferase family 9 protein [Ideonella sp. BN130291]
MTKPLIVRVRNWVGDVVLGLPALRLLEQHGYSLHIVARGKWAPALLAGYPWPVHVQPKGLMERAAQLRSIRDECVRQDPGFRRRENAFVLPQSFSSALEMRLAGLKAVGYGQEGRSFLLARSEKVTYGGSALVSYWELACKFLRVEGAPPAHIDMQLAPAKVAQARELLAQHAVPPGYIVICPFAAGLATERKLEKKWPGFPDFVRQAAREFGRRLVVYPGPGEHELARSLYPDALMLEGSDLAVYGALLRDAALVVANDTGPGHMAGALGVTVLSVLGPTVAHQWAPYGPRVHVVQHPQPPDGATVWPSVDEVMAKARELLASTAAG